MPKYRVGLEVHVRDIESNSVMLHPIHIGFFSKTVAMGVYENIDARGIAFYSGFSNQVGFVTARVTEVVEHGDTVMHMPVISRTIDYRPRDTTHV